MTSQSGWNTVCRVSATLLLALGISVVARAAAPDSKASPSDTAVAAKSPDDDKDAGKASSATKLVKTEHRAVIAAQEIAYTVTTGTLAQKSDAGDPRASVFFIAYTRDESEPVGRRPITFCFNGGPGSSSVWLHLGMLGPKRVPIPDDASTPRPPYQLVANPYSLLDRTDLVFIDPVSTGYSRPAEGEDKGQFHGYDEDIRSVGQFIHDYTTQFQRWPSPKFVLGESYGGVRAAGLSAHLRDRFNLELNGVVIISGVIDFQTLLFDSSNDLPYIVFLPSYTATAWYHNALSPELQQLPLAEVVSQSEDFAKSDYAHALLLGDQLPSPQQTSVLNQLARFTGLSTEYLERSRMRVSMARFGKQLLRDRGQTIGRFDSRFIGIDRDDAGETYDYDPSGAAIFGAFTAMLNDYVRRDLKYEEDRVYEILTGAVQPWSYRRFENRYVDASEELRQAMTANPFLKVFVACGYYDLATPLFAMEHTIAHLGLTAEVRNNLSVRYYEGGHMMYVHEPSLAQLRTDLLSFYDEATPPVP